MHSYRKRPLVVEAPTQDALHASRVLGTPLSLVLGMSLSLSLVLGTSLSLVQEADAQDVLLPDLGRVVDDELVIEERRLVGPVGGSTYVVKGGGAIRMEEVAISRRGRDQKERSRSVGEVAIRMGEGGGVAG